LVKRGTVPIGGSIVTISEITKISTPEPTVSDKDAADLAQKIRYLIDQAEAILAQLNVKLDTRASESTLSALNTKIPSDPAREGGNLATIASRLNVNLDTRASESTLSTLNNKIQSQSAGLFVKDLSVGVSAIQVDTDSAYRDEVIILADSANSAVVYVGNSTSQLFPLAAGASIAIRKTALNLIYVRAASGTQSVHIISGGA